MKRFLLFSGDNYYPKGGWGDFKGSFDSLWDALMHPRDGVDWWHVIDGKTGKKVLGGVTRPDLRKVYGLASPGVGSETDTGRRLDAGPERNNP